MSPPSQRCKTCGSDDPERCDQEADLWPEPHSHEGGNCCPDSFHNAPPSQRQITISQEEAARLRHFAFLYMENTEPWILLRSIADRFTNASPDGQEARIAELEAALSEAHHELGKIGPDEVLDQEVPAIEGRRWVLSDENGMRIIAVRRHLAAALKGTEAKP